MAYRPDELPKEIKQEIRQLAARVHERALAEELARLEGEFGRWRAGELDPFEVEASIHRFHEGPARRLWNSFNTNSLLVLTALAAEALAEGTLADVPVSAEARAYLEDMRVLHPGNGNSAPL